MFRFQLAMRRDCGNNWKEIWKKRTDHFDEIDMAAPEVIFLELKRIDALMYGAKLYDSL